MAELVLIGWLLFLGNTEAALRAHVFPCYLTEPEDLRAEGVTPKAVFWGNPCCYEQHYSAIGRYKPSTNS